MRSVRTWCAAGVLLSVAAVSGCVGSVDDTGRGGGDPDEPLAVRVERALGMDRAIVGDGAVGFESHWWVVEDTGRRAARALASLGATNVDDGWRREGLRVVRLERARLGEFLVEAPPGVEWRRSWLGERSRWTAVIDGRALSEDGRVIFGGRAIAPGAGTPRLLGRGWVEPVFPGDAGLRVELALQLRTDERATAFSLEAPRDLERERDRGPLFDGMTLSTLAARDEVLIVLPAPPGEDWAELAAEGSEAVGSVGGGAPTGDDTGDGDASALSRLDALLEAVDAGAPGAAAFAGAEFGPRAAEVRTIGETMLLSEDSAGRAMTAVVVLIPRLPEEYRLLRSAER